MSLQLETLTNNDAEQKCEQYTLTNPSLLTKPADLPEGYIATNPSGIWTTTSQSGKNYDIMYLRVEPEGSHLGKSAVVPYTVDVTNFSKPLLRYNEAEAIMGEDPSLTRINRRLSNGAIERIWLLSCVDAQPFHDRPDDVESLHTRFYAGSDLKHLEHIADGPAGMKDIRISADNPTGSSTKLHVYGRPQPQAYSGNISYTTVASINDLTEQVIREAPIIDESLMPIGSGVWGGVNDVIRSGTGKNILLTHRAWCLGEEDEERHYQAELLEHDTLNNCITVLGVLATADLFPAGTIKQNKSVGLGGVVFPGGGYNGTLQYASFGVRDGSIGIGRVQHR